MAIAADGTFARLFRWLGPGNLTTVETIPAPIGYLLSSVLPLSDGNMAMAVRGVGDPPGSVTALAHYDRSGNTYRGITVINEGVLSHSQAANVMVFDRDPFAGDALEWESFALAGWALSAKVVSGKVEAEYQTDPGLPGGLGESLTASLVPRRALPPAAMALANQWEPDSSVFFAVSPTAPGGAGVSVEPPPGSYGGAINVSFTAAAGVSVHYRVGNGAWQNGQSPAADFSSGVSPTISTYTGGAPATGHRSSKFRTRMWSIRFSSGTASEDRSTLWQQVRSAPSIPRRSSNTSWNPSARKRS